MVNTHVARWAVWFLLAATAAVGGQPGFTYNWTLEMSESFYPISSGIRTFGSDTNRLYMCFTDCIDVYDRDLNRIARIDRGVTKLLVNTNAIYIVFLGSQGFLMAHRKSDFSVLWGHVAVGSVATEAGRGMDMDEDLLYIIDTQYGLIRTYDKRNGTLVRSWGGDGDLPEQFRTPLDIAVDGELLYICDNKHNLVKLFTKGGTFVRSFSVPGPGEVRAFGNFIYVGASDGLRIYDRNDNLLWRSSTQDGLAGCKVYCDQGVIVVDAASRFRRLTGPTYRTLGLKDFNELPIPLVTNVVQRRGASVLDIDYVVRDPDDTIVSAYAAAFRMPTSGSFVPSLTNLIPVCTFVDGTDGNVGTNIAVGTNYRLSWDMQADGILSVIPSYGDVKVAILARDRRDALLDLHLLQIPAMDGNPALTINRVPLQQTDFLPVWFWLIASRDAAVSLTTGSVFGVGGDYGGQVLATGTNTTAAGRGFLFQRLNVREATPQEVQLAREAGTPGTVQKWTPLRTPPPSGSKVNGIGFVTDPTNGWWVVPLSP